ncbi:MAG: hypothetical protein IJO73_09060, partial [Clostridia bacterium]|nr:hypothetical protein [Clostridia bacterium]
KSKYLLYATPYYSVKQLKQMCFISQKRLKHICFCFAFWSALTAAAPLGREKMPECTNRKHSFCHSFNVLEGFYGLKNP